MERRWFRQVLDGQEVAARFSSAAEPDGDFDGAAAGPGAVEEYARHNGHAGLLRERIDGAVGV